MTFDATDLCGGEFAAQVAVTSNDPITPEVAVPVSLDVNGDPDITVAPIGLAYGPHYLGSVVTDTLTVTNDGCDMLTVSSLTSDNLEFTALPTGPFTVAPDLTQIVLVTYAPVTVGPVSGVLTIASDDPDEPAITVSLSGTGVPPPVITVNPDSLSAILYSGDIDTQVLTIGNAGQSDLDWSVSAILADTLVARMRGASYTIRDYPRRAPAPLAGDLNGMAAPSPQFGRRVFTSDRHARVTPPVLLMVTFEPENDAFNLALQRLGLSYTLVGDWGELEYELTNGGPWSMVIVSSYGYSALPSALDALEDHLAAQGNLIFGDWGVFNYSGHGLLTELGVSYQSRFTTPMNFSAVDPNHPCFQDPNDVHHLDWTDNQAGFDGQIVSVLSGAHQLAAFEGNPNSGAIVLSASERAVFNAFQVANYAADGDGDGLTDIVELAENEIVLVGLRVTWLTVEPGEGVVPPGATQDLTVTYDATTQPGGEYAATIFVRSNDPISPVVTVPAHLTVIGDMESLDVSIVATIGALTSDVTTFGVAVDATDDYDAAHDLFAVDPGPVFITTYFPHPEWQLPGGNRFRADFREPYDLAAIYKSWRFEVSTDQVGEIVLTFVPSAGVPPATGLLLVDEATGQMQDLAVDPTYNFLTSAPGVREFSVRLGAGLPAPYPTSRSLAAGWSMVGAPLEPPAGSTMADVLLSQAPPGSWLFAWDPATVSYVLLPPSAPYVQGQGCWLYTPGTFDWTMTGTMDTDEVTVPLALGWTLVGYPLWFTGDMAGVMVVRGGVRYTFADAVAQGLIAGMVFDYGADGAYQLTTDLVPWRGYWVASYVSGVDLEFQYDIMEAAEQMPRPTVLAAKQRQNDWTTTIQIEGSNAQITLGQQSGATDGFDAAWDFPVPPSSPSAPASATIAMTRASWAPAAGQTFLSDIRAVGDQPLVFSARVTAAAPGVINLSWDPTDLSEVRDLEIRSGGHTLVRSMRSQGGIELIVGDAPLDLEFATAGETPEAAWLAEGLSLNNQPNPFNPSTQFRFNLPRDGETEIMIYDTRGVLVQQIRAGQLSAGPTRLSWDGTDQRGRHVASGVYLYRLIQNGQQLGDTQKMVLLK